MRGTNFSALVSSIDIVSRSPVDGDGPLNAAQPAASAATRITPITVSTDSATRHVMRRTRALCLRSALVSGFSGLLPENRALTPSIKPVRSTFGSATPCFFFCDFFAMICKLLLRIN